MLENVLTDASSTVTVVDPFKGPWKDRFRQNLRVSGDTNRVTIVEGFSQIELRKLPVDSFDFIYIDGSHLAPDVLEDAVLAWRLVKTGGLLLFDDYRWPGNQPGEVPENLPRPAIDTFYDFFMKHFDVVHNGYQVILKKR